MRTPVNPRVVMRRPLADRVLLLFPRLLPLALRIVLRLRPGSAPRRRFLDYVLRRMFAAINRRDFDVALLGMEPDAEIEFPGVELTGIASSYHGHDGFRAFWADWLRDWEQVSHGITAVIDLGDRIVIRVWGHHLAPKSGLRLDSDSGYLVEFRDGRVKHSVVWFHWSDAVKALGLDQSTDQRGDLRRTGEHDSRGIVTTTVPSAPACLRRPHRGMGDQRPEAPSADTAEPAPYATPALTPNPAADRHPFRH
jgi:ketosteroid isomerase-like protein